MNKSFPTFTKTEIENKIKLANKEKDGWEFLWLLTDHYFDFMSSFKNQAEAFQEFNDEQHTLLAFNYLYGQVCNGGFLQLIQNGYGTYIFDNPFSEHIEKWGAKQTSEIVNKAKIIYDKNKEDLEKETTLNEFSEMYKDYEDFEPLDSKFYEVMDVEVDIIKDYVYKNIGNFAIVE